MDIKRDRGVRRDKTGVGFLSRSLDISEFFIFWKTPFMTPSGYNLETTILLDFRR